jgi:hypothetical protein
MAFSLNDIIKQQVNSAAGGLEIPAALKNQVLGGLSDSILGSLTQTATKAGGINIIKDLFGGKTPVESSPVTQLAGNLFNTNVLKKLGLGAVLGTALTKLIPNILGGVTKVFKDQNGDGKVDMNDILIALGGSGIGKSVVTSVLGGLFKRR